MLLQGTKWSKSCVLIGYPNKKVSLILMHVPTKMFCFGHMINHLLTWFIQSRCLNSGLLPFSCALMDRDENVKSGDLATIQSSLPHNKIGQYKANIILISVRKSERSRTPTHPSIIKYLLQVGGMVYCVWKQIEWLYAYKLHSWMSWMRDTHGLYKLNLGKTLSQGQVWCILSWKKNQVDDWLTLLELCFCKESKSLQRVTLEWFTYVEVTFVLSGLVTKYFARLLRLRPKWTLRVVVFARFLS